MINRRMASCRTARTSVTALAGLLLLSAPVAGQDELFRPTVAQSEETCRALGPELRQEDDRFGIREAYSHLRSCPEAGPALTASLWRQPPSDSDLVARDLVYASIAIRDERIFRTVVEVAGDRGQPRELRLSAIAVATHFADPMPEQ